MAAVMQRPVAVPSAAKPRPYWHVDAKWVCGIVFAMLVTATLRLAAVWRLTSADAAIPMAAAIAAAQFSPDGLDDPGDIEELRRRAESQPGDVINPLPGRPVTITRAQLEAWSPRELRLEIFRQIVESFYYLGSDKAAAGYSPEEQQQINQQAGLKLFTRSSHRRLQSALPYALALTVLALAGLVYFSHRFGRLVSPGMILVAACLPGSLVGLLLATAQPGRDGPASALPIEVAQRLGAMVLATFGWPLAAGGFALVVAGVGKLMVRKPARS